MKPSLKKKQKTKAFHIISFLDNMASWLHTEVTKTALKNFQEASVDDYEEIILAKRFFEQTERIIVVI
jgi:hypothetical protein